MKIFTLLAILSVSLMANAQNWCPPGAVWTYNHYGFDFSGKSVLHYEKDTTISGQPCQMVIEHTTAIFPYQVNFMDTFYLYEQSDTVWAYTDSQFVSVYFFNVAVGDVFSIPTRSWQCDSAIQWRVDSIATVILNGESLRYYSASMLVPDPIVNPQTMEVMERFGSINNHLVPYFLCIFDDGSSYRLRCYEDDQFSQYQIDTFVACDYLYNGVSKVDNNTLVTLYPNPVTNTLSVIVPNTLIAKYQVLDYSGKVVINSPADRGDIHIEVANLPAGIYLVKLEMANGQYAVKRFVKQ